MSKWALQLCYLHSQTGGSSPSVTFICLNNRSVDHRWGWGAFCMVHEHTNQAHTHSNTLSLLSGGELLVKYIQLRKSPYYHMLPLFPIPISLPYSLPLKLLVLIICQSVPHLFSFFSSKPFPLSTGIMSSLCNVTPHEHDCKRYNVGNLRG